MHVCELLLLCCQICFGIKFRMVCLVSMVHPSPLDSIGPMIAVVQLNVTYTGRTAHAGAAPWQGINAQDAGVLAVSERIKRMQISLDPHTFDNCCSTTI